MFAYINVFKNILIGFIIHMPFKPQSQAVFFIIFITQNSVTEPIFPYLPECSISPGFLKLYEFPSKLFHHMLFHAVCSVHSKFTLIRSQLLAVVFLHVNFKRVVALKLALTLHWLHSIILSSDWIWISTSSGPAEFFFSAKKRFLSQSISFQCALTLFLPLYTRGWQLLLGDVQGESKSRL